MRAKAANTAYAVIKTRTVTDGDDIVFRVCSCVAGAVRY